jgi:F0F1-type ATP synthase delta subunit
VRIRDASRRYANALMELAKQKGTQHEALQQLSAISQAFAAEPSIQAYFVNPTISPEQKITLLKGALQGQNLLEEVSNTLLLLVEK